MARTTHATANREQTISIQNFSEDAFVRSSPLVVAMVCKDGVALLATHIDEPLQFDANDEDKLPLDLPFPSYNQRILRLGRSGSAMMTCGWRADGHGRLLDKARSIISKNVETFGNEGTDTLPYALSLYLTSIAGSESLRALSCAALLATPGDVSQRPCLWLVDEFGATAVRAMCLGGGYRTQNGARSTISEAVQKELSSLFKRQTDSSLLYLDMTAEGALAWLMKTLQEKELIRPDMRLELAILPAGEGHQQQIQRRTIADILRQQPAP